MPHYLADDPAGAALCCAHQAFTTGSSPLDHQEPIAARPEQRPAPFADH